MKKIGIVLAIIVALTLVGCASSGGSSGSSKPAAGGAALPPYTVDLSKLGGKVDVSKLSAGEQKSNVWSDSRQITENGKVVGLRNVTPFAKNYENLFIAFSELPDLTQYSRVTITCKYYDAAGAEIAQGYTKAMVSLLYDIGGEIRADGNKNILLKEFNLGVIPLNTDKGMRVRINAPVGGILLQNSTPDVKFIELTSVTFHNSTASGQ